MASWQGIAAPAFQLKPGVRLDAAVEAVWELVVTIGNPSRDVVADYVAWADGAFRKLSNCFVDDDVAGLIETRRYWALCDMAGNEINNGAAAIIDREMRSREEAFRQLHQALVGWRAHWSSGGGVVMPDTNVLLHRRGGLHADWSLPGAAPDSDIRLVVPLVAITELDRVKRSTRPARPKAREVLQTLRGLADNDGRPMPLTVSDPQRQARRVTVEVLMDPPGWRRLPDPDEEILARALYMHETIDRRVVLVTFDRTMQLRAAMVGVEAVELPAASDTSQDEPPARN
jgi:rRNA-processing protein FCF1